MRLHSVNKYVMQSVEQSTGTLPKPSSYLTQRGGLFTLQTNATKPCNRKKSPAINPETGTEMSCKL